MSIIKYLLFGFNLVVFIVGLVFIIGGAVLQTAFSDYLAFFGGNVNRAAVFIIAIGIVCLGVSFFGCCGAFKENHCMIITFAVLLTVVLLLEIIAAITVFVVRSEVEDLLRENMKQTIPNYDNEGVHHTWDHMQEKLQCCGVESFMDWEDNDAFKQNETVPDSCCRDSSQPMCAGPVLRANDTATIYDEGCADQLIEWSRKNIAVIGTITIVFACIEVVGIVLACILGGGIRQQYQQV